MIWPASQPATIPTTRMTSRLSFDMATHIFSQQTTCTVAGYFEDVYRNACPRRPPRKRISFACQILLKAVREAAERAEEGLAPRAPVLAAAESSMPPPMFEGYRHESRPEIYTRRGLREWAMH